jgi:nitrate/nitrite transport system substrate-binding protein
VSTHNYELRYWLAAGGIHPGYYAPHKGDISGQIDAKALLSVTTTTTFASLRSRTRSDGPSTGADAGEPHASRDVKRA